MAEANPKVMEMVESELKKNADISNDALLEKAKRIDKSVENLTARQFNARYPLQVKRRMKPRKRAGGRKKAGTRGRRRATTSPRGGRATGRSNDGNRGEVRKVLVQLARDVASADKGGVVDVIAGIDRYVDRVVKAKS